jgi:hypothetical protein
VLSSVLDILDVQVASSARFEAAGDWGLAFPQPGQLKVIAVLAGQCWAAAGGAEPVPLQARDCLLLAGSQDFTMLSSPGQAALPQPAILPGPWPPVVYYQTGPGQESSVNGALACCRRAVVTRRRLVPARSREPRRLGRLTSPRRSRPVPGSGG